MGDHSGSERIVGRCGSHRGVRRLAEPSVVMQHKSSSRSPNHRFVIALHSLDGNLQTGPTISPLEKSASNLAQELWQDTFSEFGFSAKYAELWRLSPIFRAKPQSFSAVETRWRRMQSAANPSPVKFPANREKYREFREFGGA